MAVYAELFKTFESPSHCGENLEYSPEFVALQQAVAGKPEQQFGSTIYPEQTPDWALIEREALRLCERTCDIRVLVPLIHAWTELKGLAGFADGVELLATALAQRWDGIHPLLHLDDEYDPMLRINALIALGDQQGAVRSLRSATLLKGGHGQISVREAEALLDGSRNGSDSYPGGRARLVEALRQAQALQAPEVLAVSRALAGLQAMESLVTSRIGEEWTPDFQSAQRTLGILASVMHTAASHEAPAGPAVAQPPASTSMPPEPAPAAAAEASAVLPSAVSWREVAILSRDDAALALEKVCHYFESHEPSHPAPFLIRRAQQTIPMDFYEMLKNLAPSGLDQFETWVPKSRAE